MDFLFFELRDRAWRGWAECSACCGPLITSRNLLGGAFTVNRMDLWPGFRGDGAECLTVAVVGIATPRRGLFMVLSAD